jgi:hypothetical protein
MYLIRKIPGILGTGYVCSDTAVQDLNGLYITCSGNIQYKRLAPFKQQGVIV